ncbi:MAG TPA: phage baseplate assembly protein V [Bryobacteraceae bacterium]|nr:phage baseplate assembly protein V [Bryobacteraceae bacterium]
MTSSKQHKREKKRYPYKYRGTVVTNIDPLETGRILVQVPDVLGDDPCIWASSASPLAGLGMGAFWVPPIGSGVWIEFEGGDPDMAVWTGCWRGAATDKPVLANAGVPGNPPIVIGSTSQNNIAVSDTPLAPGIETTGIMIQSGASMIVISPEGIKIVAPKIEINGLLVVNLGALTVAV